MPAYRLPLELELLILELATPPLLFDHIHWRVKFLRQIALVHRSFTKWAQGKLHEQFKFTFRGRVGEQKRLQERLTAGFGSPPSGTLPRLYLDMRAWSEDGKWDLDRLDGLSDENLDIEPPRHGEKPGASEQDPEDVRVWRPLDILCPWLYELRSVSLLLPFDFALDGFWTDFVGAHYLEIDDHAFDSAWDGLHTIAPKSLTTLVLRDVTSDLAALRLPSLRVLVLVRSSIGPGHYAQAVAAFPTLDVLESIASEPPAHPDDLFFFRPTARTARFYQTTCPDPNTDGYFAYKTGPALPPRLETCTFTWLDAPPVPSSSPDPLDTLRAALVAKTEANAFTIECVRSQATEEETIERILKDLVI